MTEKEVKFLMEEVKAKLESLLYHSEGHSLSEIKLMNNKISYDFQMTTIDTKEKRTQCVNIYGFSIKKGLTPLKTGWISNGKVQKQNYPLHEQLGVEQYDLFLVIESKGENLSAKTGSTSFKLYYPPDWEVEKELANWKDWTNKL